MPVDGVQVPAAAGGGKLQRLETQDAGEGAVDGVQGMAHAGTKVRRLPEAQIDHADFTARSSLRR